MSNISDKGAVSITKFMQIPENVIKFILSIEKCNIILGIGNTCEKDLSRVKDMMSDGIFSTLHLITISSDVTYDYAESLSHDSPQHIPLKFDFCDGIAWYKIQRILAGKVNIFTFDMSTTKFINWKFTTNKFNIFTSITCLIKDSGVLYYPVEPSKSLLPAQSSMSDEISLIDKLKNVCWKGTRFVIDKKAVNVYRTEYISPSLHSQTITHFKSALTGVKNKIFILTNNNNETYVRFLIDSMFKHLNAENSIIMYCDTAHRKVYNETNIYFYYSAPDLIYETYQVFKMSNVFNHVGITATGPVTNEEFSTMTKGWIVVSNNHKVFKQSGAVCSKDLDKVLPEYSYIATLTANEDVLS
jgi:hypothetical protein